MIVSVAVATCQMVYKDVSNLWLIDEDDRITTVMMMKTLTRRKDDHNRAGFVFCEQI